MRKRRTSILSTFLQYLIAGVIVFGVTFWFSFYLKNQESNYDTKSCLGNITYSSMALMAYAEKHGFLPTGNSNYDDKPPVSWRVAVLPFKSFDTVVRDSYHFDEPWDGPENSKLHSSVCSEFHCQRDSDPKTDTSYLTVQGPRTFFPDQGTVKLTDHEDGLTNSILIVETHQSGIHWMEPRDLRIEEAVKGLNRTGELSISSPHTYFNSRKQDGAFVAFADGRVQFLNTKIDPKVLRSLLEIDHPDKPKEKYISP